MVHIKHRIGCKANIEKVYEAIATVDGISNWWTRNTSGESSEGKLITTRFFSEKGMEMGSMAIEVQQLISPTKIQCKFLDGPKEWIDTIVEFNLHQENDYTIVLFSHLNWREEVEFKSHCSMKWAVFLLSLKQYIETGTGNPAPNDFKIDNWN